jgi:predicted ATPase/DNA-binding XRE family transcriptional regulator
MNGKPAMATTSTLTFAERLRRHRLAAGLTQEDLAERAGLSARGVQDLERGARMAPRAETVRMLADALGLDVAARTALFAAARPELTVSPASKAPARPRSSLPLAPTTLVGREREVAAACATLRRPDGAATARLLTLTGPGGVGKTRLALAVATELTGDFADSVAWVELAPLRDPVLVPAAVAQALGIREDGDRPLAQAVAATLAGRHLLLVLDNCEHLLAAMPLISELLTNAPRLMVLATSRTRLRLRGEREQPIGPLALPEDGGPTAPLAGLAGVAAVRLFVERAQAVAPGFALTAETAAVVAEICHRLDGLPLAIELAAARVNILSPRALLERLEYRLHLLSGGPRDLPPRQQTMRDAIAWSYDLLTGHEQTLFRHLAVFSGGFALEAAEWVGGRRSEVGRMLLTGDLSSHLPPPTSDLAPDTLELIASLLDQSLLRVADGFAGEPRCTMLETVREFALERLEASGDGDAIRRAHAAYYLALAEDIQARIHGPEGAVLLDRLETEHDNLRAALAWLIEEEDTELALRLAYASWRFWWMRSHLDQGRLWLERALALPDKGDAATIVLRPKTLVSAGYFARVQGDFARAIGMGEHALALARQIGDTNGTSAAFHLLGLVATDQGELDLARSYHEAALTLDREAGYSHGVAYQLSNLGDVALAQGDVAAAAAFGEEALTIWRDRGDAWGVASALVLLGKTKIAERDERGAVVLLRRSLTTNAALGDKEIAARAIGEIASIAGGSGRFALAARLFASEAGLRESISAPLSPAERARSEQALSATRAALEDATFNQAWEAGRALSLGQAVSEALAAANELG